MRNYQTTYYGFRCELDDLLKWSPEFKNYLIKKIQNKIEKNEKKIEYEASLEEDDRSDNDIEKYKEKIEKYKNDIIDVNNGEFNHDKYIDGGDFPLCMNEIDIHIAEYGACIKYEEYIYGFEINNNDDIDKLVEMKKKLINITGKIPKFLIIEAYY